MGYGIKLKVFGEYACFTRPEMKVERVSYDVITPSAARGILESIYWKPAIKWVIDKIHVLNEIQFTNVRRNEISQKISESNIKKAIRNSEYKLYQDVTAIRQQRAATVLKNVCYVIEAHFEMTEEAGSLDTPEKHYNIAIRRIKKGQCFHQPCLGTREFSANFELANKEDLKSYYTRDMDLGWMLWDFDFNKKMEPIFYRPIMKAGVIEVQKYLDMR